MTSRQNTENIKKEFKNTGQEVASLYDTKLRKLIADNPGKFSNFELEDEQNKTVPLADKKIVKSFLEILFSPENPKYSSVIACLPELDIGNYSLKEFLESIHAEKKDVKPIFNKISMDSIKKGLTKVAKEKSYVALCKEFLDPLKYDHFIYLDKIDSEFESTFIKDVYVNFPQELYLIVFNLCQKIKDHRVNPSGEISDSEKNQKSFDKRLLDLISGSESKHGKLGESLKNYIEKNKSIFEKKIFIEEPARLTSENKSIPPSPEPTQLTGENENSQSSVSSEATKTVDIESYTCHSLKSKSIPPSPKSATEKDAESKKNDYRFDIPLKKGLFQKPQADESNKKKKKSLKSKLYKFARGFFPCVAPHNKIKNNDPSFRQHSFDMSNN